MPNPKEIGARAKWKLLGHDSCVSCRQLQFRTPLRPSGIPGDPRNTWHAVCLANRNPSLPAACSLADAMFGVLPHELFAKKYLNEKLCGKYVPKTAKDDRYINCVDPNSTAFGIQFPDEPEDWIARKERE